MIGLGGAGGDVEFPRLDVGAGDNVWSNGGSSSSRDRGAFSTAELVDDPFPTRDCTDDDDEAGKSDAVGSTSEGTEVTVLVEVGSADVTAELEPPQLVHGAVTGAGLVKMGR